MQPNQILCDRYQLQHQLGKAPGRQTWLAHDLSKQPVEAVVIKLLAFSEMVQWDDFKLFEREAQVLQQLRHPHIPRYRDSFTLEENLSWFGIVQDYVSGTSLKQKVEKGYHFTEQQVRQIALNILHLLAYLHELSPPILHRDIKPSNLMWDSENNFIYLVDFGAVQDRAAREGVTFTIVGTYGYAPLEQFGGRAVPASDLYGLGATLIYLLTGVSPADLPQQDLRIQFRDRVSVSPTFVNWIETLVEPDVAKRFQSAQEALEALRSPTPPRSQRSALTVAQSRSLRPPYNTRVQIRRSPDQLLLKIPGRGTAGLWLFTAIVLGILRLVFTYSTLFYPLLLLSLILITSYYFQDIAPTFVQIKGDRFFIYKRLLNRSFTLEHGLEGNDIPIYLNRGLVCEIRDVFHTVKNFGMGNGTHETRVVVIQASDREICFGPGLKFDEYSWLVDVIQDWLAM